MVRQEALQGVPESFQDGSPILRVETMSRAVMQQALDALEQLDGLDTDTKCVTIYVSKEIEALRAELAKPEPEHVAWTYESIFERPSFVNGSSGFIWNNSHASDMIPLYRKEDL